MGRRLHRPLRSEQLESRRPLAADLAALDINDDLHITALDALIIIDQINARSSSGVASAEGEVAVTLGDTNNDGLVTPVDVLNVINQINTGIVEVSLDTTSPDTTSPDTTSGDVVSVPTDGGSSTDVTTPVDETVPTPSDTNTGDTSTGEPGNSTDDTTTDPTDGTDSSDDNSDVVSDPTDGSDDSSTDDDTSDDDTSDDDDSNSNDGSECEHGGVPASGARPVSAVGGGFEGHHHHHRGGSLDDLDSNGDGAISSDEVPASVWNRLSAADADNSGSVTEAELAAYKEAQRVAAVEAFFDQLDKDSSGTITSADVSRSTWRFLSRADADSDGAITVDELLAVPTPGRWGH